MKISVITVTRNCAETISQCLNSIFSQDYENYESIVIDGNSTDGTLGILESYRSRINYLISESDAGIYDAMNKGLRLASGDVVGFLNADDMLADTKVFEKIASIFKDNNIDAVYGDLVYVSRLNSKKILRYWKSSTYKHSDFKLGWMPPHPTLYIRKTTFDKLGNFDTRYKIAADYDLIIRLLYMQKAKAIYIPTVLVRMRSGGISNRSLRMILKKSTEDFQILKFHKMGGLLPLFFKNFFKIKQFFDKF
jgi:glycosyltransferase